MVLQKLCEIIHPRNLKVDVEMHNDLMCMCVCCEMNQNVRRARLDVMLHWCRY